MNNGMRVGDQAMTQFVIFTDVDGTLLDVDTYSFEAARQALQALKAREIPVVLVSSKTRAEMEPLRRQLDHRDPFIVENGAAVYVPRGQFGFPLDRSRAKASYDVIELGLPYHMLRDVLKQVEDAVETPLVGFGDLSVEEIMRVTGLPRADAALAKQREYDEPYIVEGPPTLVEEVCRQVVVRGLRWTKGGRFFHLTGPHDKGQAAALLMRCYRRQQRLQERQARIESVGIGDSVNDAPLLAVVDHPILVQRRDGSHDPNIHLPGIRRVSGAGPIGWNRVVMEFLEQAPG